MYYDIQNTKYNKNAKIFNKQLNSKMICSKVINKYLNINKNIMM